MICEIPTCAESNPAKSETLSGFSPALARKGYAVSIPEVLRGSMARAKFFMRTSKIRLMAKFGKLTLIRFIEKRESGSGIWECECECGGMTNVQDNNLRSGHTQSCGCLDRPHGKSMSREYKSWIAVKRRCCDPNNGGYARYGARGIKICEKWINDFPAFYADMGPKPTPKHSIDRIDNEKGYEPGNCRWATMAEQARNKRNTTFLEFNGKRQTLPEWSRELKIHHATLVHRLYDHGWTPEKAFTVPPKRCLNNKRPVTQLNAATGLELKQWPSVTIAAMEYGVSRRAIRRAAEGIRKTAIGFRWQYTNDPNIPIYERNRQAPQRR